jgi:membrane-bound lytic murein transglycosylase A
MKLVRRWVATLFALLCCWGTVTALGGEPSLLMQIDDDLDRPGLVAALTRSLTYLEALPPATRFPLESGELPVSRLIDSARHLRQLVQGPLDGEMLMRRINEEFMAIGRYPDANDPEQRLLVTGYYQPIFAGSLHRQSPYLYPLYRLPPDLVVRSQEGRGPSIGRLVDGRLVPYWTRREIEQGNLLQGLELAWLRDPFDVFTLHVQGSGIIQLPDGSVRGLRYAQKNGHPYTSIGRYLVETGQMELAEVTMDSIRAYLNRHPHQHRQILEQNNSYIFFDWGSPDGAIGNINRPLTPGRSVAADQCWYPPGSILFLQSRRPVMERGAVSGWQPIRRLVTVQDTGSAIKGPGRIDIFWGRGEQAGLEAGQMKEKGEVALLLRRKPPASRP